MVNSLLLAGLAVFASTTQSHPHILSSGVTGLYRVVDDHYVGSDGVAHVYFKQTLHRIDSDNGHLNVNTKLVYLCKKDGEPALTWLSDGQSNTTSRGNNAIAQDNPTGGDDYGKQPPTEQAQRRFCDPYDPSQSGPTATTTHPSHSFSSRPTSTTTCSTC
ncbi:extracellular elastinolytic metalloproteinase [Metarhizium acridum CQMa 102]|uniref:Extracellular elastinolytic metalloproteinase n=1 Tax=Metarhizium acridum (strain CQMa 102) TaxID=655827 RepID=E9ED51_METAQ|nr:extracellular elastinolytic metalloproteinase [Metarhizium acridum CQMa 102]EFY86134.1 extracellular elastinolytic metalloproteinase [Metarhizium acridum CQMa 102]